MGGELLLLIGFVIVLAIIMMMFFVSRYIRCPAGKILVVYGKVEGGSSFKAYAGGAVFVFPIIQSYDFIDLESYRFDVQEKFYTKDDVSIKTKMKISFAVSNSLELMELSATRLLGLTRIDISALAEDIIRGEIKRLFKNKDIVDLAIQVKSDDLLNDFYKVLGKELNRIGLEVINIDLHPMYGLEEHISSLEDVNNRQSIPDVEIMERLRSLEKSIENNTKERRKLLSEKLSLLVKIKS